MKKIICAVCAAAVGFSAFAYDVTANYQIKGNAKSVVRTDYSITSKFGEYYRTPSTKVVYSYDENGKLLESSEMTARDVLVNKVENKFNEEGLLVEQIGFDSESIITWKAVFNYKNGLMSDVSEYGSDGNLKTKVIYAYNGSNVSEENCYNAEGTLVGKLVYKYEGDRLTVEDEYFADGTLDTEKQYSYTEAGNKDSITTFSGNGEMMLKEVFRYNAENVLTEITTYGADNKVASRTIVKFDDKGNFTKMTTYTVSKKFGTTVNEMSAMTEVAYEY